jgi:ketol-acid reductoisomerase
VVFIEDVGSGLKKQAAIIGVGVQFQPHFQNLREFLQNVLLFKVFLNESYTVIV